MQIKEKKHKFRFNHVNQCTKLISHSLSPILNQNDKNEIIFIICHKQWTKITHCVYLFYEGHSVNSEIRYVSAIAYLLAESWCCLYKAPTFISHNIKETIS